MNWLRKYLPGHFLGITIYMIVFFWLYVGWVTHDWQKGVGMAVFLVGAFVWDQAFHLHRHQHEIFPTWLEEWMSENRGPAVVLGAFCALVGVNLMFG